MAGYRRELRENIAGHRVFDVKLTTSLRCVPSKHLISLGRLGTGCL
jgi:hypothetical protein